MPNSKSPACSRKALSAGEMQFMKRLHSGFWTSIKYVILLAFLVWTVAPVALVIMTSFKTPFDIFQAPVKWIFEPTLANYEKAFAAGDFTLVRAE